MYSNGKSNNWLSSYLSIGRWWSQLEWCHRQAWRQMFSTPSDWNKSPPIIFSSFFFYLSLFLSFLILVIQCPRLIGNYPMEGNSKPPSTTPQLIINLRGCLFQNTSSSSTRPIVNWGEQDSPAHTPSMLMAVDCSSLTIRNQRQQRSWNEQQYRSMYSFDIVIIRPVQPQNGLHSIDGANNLSLYTTAPPAMSVMIPSVELGTWIHISWSIKSRWMDQDVRLDKFFVI